MNTSITVRIVAALVSLTATYAIVASLAIYGLPPHQQPGPDLFALAASGVAH
jgi:hypothetical protein